MQQLLYSACLNVNNYQFPHINSSSRLNIFQHSIFTIYHHKIVYYEFSYHFVRQEGFSARTMTCSGVTIKICFLFIFI